MRLPAPSGPLFVALLRYFALHSPVIGYEADAVYTQFFQSFLHQGGASDPVVAHMTLRPVVLPDTGSFSDGYAKGNRASGYK